jgi:hypothetical protein
MPDIKPIETVYNGYRFRSRLEARWAVFFDALNIKYEYEPEGFDLGDAGWYLPDFYLPEFDCFVEIKPFTIKHVGDGNEWEKKCASFRDHTDRAILLCYGSPSDDLFKYLFTFDTTDSGGGTSEYYALFTFFCGHVVICTEPTRTDRTIYTRGFEELSINGRVGTPAMFAGDRELLWERATTQYDPDAADRMNRAKTKARQARFEHGETPTT